MNELPKIGFIKLDYIIGNRKKNIPGLIPMSSSNWLRGRKDGVYPDPVDVGRNTRSLKSQAYRVSDIRELIESLSD